MPLQLTEFDQEMQESASITQNSTDRPDFEALEREFLGSLLPGIVHNLATPLSGVIGATQLLEMRANEQERLLGDLEKGVSQSADALRLQHQKSKNNIDIMSRNARHLTDLLQIIIRRFHRTAHETPGPLSLYEMVSNELLFLEADLNFKHKTRKRFDLARDAYTVHAVYKHVAAVLDEFALCTLAVHDFSRGLVELTITTNFANSAGLIELESKFFETEEAPLDTAPLELYLARVGENGAAYSMERHKGVLRLSLTLPRNMNVT